MEQKQIGRWFALCFVASMLVGAPGLALAGNVDLTGKWTGTAVTSGPHLQDGTFQVTAVMKQTDTSLKASLVITGPGDVPVKFTETGKIKGTTISIDSNKQEPVSATGTISSDGMTGSGSEANSGTWTGSFVLDKGELSGSTSDTDGDAITWSLNLAK